jgi:hypothetical protein
VQNNDSLWNMYIAGNDGTDLALAAEIRVEVDGTPGSNDMPGRILLRTTPDGSQAPVDAVKIDSAQNVTVSAGNLVIGTSGKGIDFSGVGTAAEILDDYEEGTWTVSLHDGVSAGNASATTVTGYYTKVGNLVTASFTALNNIDTTGMTGANALYFSLPFSVSATGAACGSFTPNTWTFRAGAGSLIAPVVSNNAVRGLFNSVVSTGAPTNQRVSELTSGTSDINSLTITYMAA